MTFTLDNKTSATLTADTRSAAATYTNDSKGVMGITWNSDFNTWAQELRTWGAMVSAFTADTRN